MRALIILTGFTVVAAVSHFYEKRANKKKEVELGSAVCAAWMKNAGKTVVCQQ